MTLLTLRVELAGFLSALILVYSILVIAWVVKSWVIVSGARVGGLAPVFHFLDATVEPFMNLFRRFIPPIGPVDISPIVALLVLQIGGGLIVRLVGG
jgi:uncharacterized protein YggT (Ycf19 family)